MSSGFSSPYRASFSFTCPLHPVKVSHNFSPISCPFMSFVFTHYIELPCGPLKHLHHMYSTIYCVPGPGNKKTVSKVLYVVRHVNILCYEHYKVGEFVLRQNRRVFVNAKSAGHPFDCYQSL